MPPASASQVRQSPRRSSGSPSPSASARRRAGLLLAVGDRVLVDRAQAMGAGGQGTGVAISDDGVDD
eukprot:SAG31_NODE_23922_length_492_cov_2.391858_1_plen_66_part_10